MWLSTRARPVHGGSEQPEIGTSKFTLSHELGSEWVSERASERESAAERTSEASSAEQVNEWAVRVNERADKRVAQYVRPEYWID